jgi:protein TonB
MSYQDYSDDKEAQGFFKRNGIAIIVGVVLALLISTVGVLVKMYGKVPPPRKPEEIVIHLQPMPPMPPPPPPPPPPPQPPEKKFVEQPKDLKPLEKPKDVAKAPDKPAGPPGPKGPASDNGLNQAGGGGGGGGGDGGGSEFGPYAAEVVATIKARLQANSKTSHANFEGLKTRIWADSTGRITKATISGTTGDPAVDDALKNEVLVGMQLQEPPPDGMPMPIVLRMSEQRAN